MPRTSGPPLLLLISAPSGAGKTTLCQQLLAARPDLSRAVTCTTRPPRQGETQGVDYHFLEGTTFEQRVQAGDFLEHATVFGHRYGTLKSELRDRLRQGRDVLLTIEVQGAATVRARAREDPELGRALVSVFLTPPSLEVLEQRLRRRGTEPDQVIRERLSVARRELAHWDQFDYLIVSGKVEEDLQRALAIVEAEKLRTPRVRAPEL
jgi:guanylate kinase